MSFAQGFNVGFGSVMSAAEMAQRAERQKKEDEWNAKQRGWQEEDRRRSDTLRKELVAAAQDPVAVQGHVSGAEGNRLFTKDANTAAELAASVRAEQEMRDGGEPVERSTPRPATERSTSLTPAGSSGPSANAGHVTGPDANRAFLNNETPDKDVATSLRDEAKMRDGGAPIEPRAAAAVGNKIYDNPSAAANAVAAGSGKLGRVQRVGEAYGRAGEVGKQLEMEKLYREMKKEGGIDALEAALNPGMSTADIEASYNSTGKGRIKPGSLVREFYDVDMPGFGKVRTARISAIGEDGQEIKIENALGARMSFLPIEKQLEIQGKGVEAGQRDRQISATERTADATVMNAKSNEQYRQNLAKQFEETMGFKREEAQRQAGQWAATHQLARQRLQADIDAAKAAGQTGVPWKDIEKQLDNVSETALKTFGPTKEDPETAVDPKTGAVTRPRDEKLQYANDVSVASQGLIRAAGVGGKQITAAEAMRAVTDGRFDPKARLTQRNAAGETRVIEGPAFVTPDGRAYPVNGDVPVRFQGVGTTPFSQAGPPDALAGAGRMPSPAELAARGPVPNARPSWMAGTPGAGATGGPIGFNRSNFVRPQPAAPAAAPESPQVQALRAGQAQVVAQIQAAQARGDQAEVARLNQQLIEMGAALQGSAR